MYRVHSNGNTSGVECCTNSVSSFDSHLLSNKSPQASVLEDQKTGLLWDERAGRGCRAEWNRVLLWAPMDTNLKGVWGPASSQCPSNSSISPRSSQPPSQGETHSPSHLRDLDAARPPLTGDHPLHPMHLLPVFSLPPHPFPLFPDPPFLPQSCPLPAISVKHKADLLPLLLRTFHGSPVPSGEIWRPSYGPGGFCALFRSPDQPHLSTGQSYTTFPLLANPNSFSCLDWPLAWFNALLPLK